jgi:hypothetical protein
MHSKMGPIFKTCRATLSQLAEFALQNMWCTALKIMTCTHPAWLIVFLQVSRTMTWFFHGLDGTKARFTTYFGMNRYDSEMVIPDQLHHKTCVLQYGPSGSNAARRCDVHPHLWLARSDSMSHRSCFFRWATHLYGLICGWFVVDLYHFQIFSVFNHPFWWVKNFDPYHGTHVSLSGKWPLKIIGGPATKQATPN